MNSLSPQSVYRQVVKLLGSRVCFYFVWAVSILQSTWIAVSSRYPMAFDEAYHLEIIKLHAKMLSPIFTSQPEGPATYGALVRDPSFIHHYILSFPLRIAETLGLSEFATVVGLRFMNIAMFAVGLLLFRRLLMYTKASSAAINATFLFFILIPTVPLLAGQINYDNLQFLLLPLTLIYSARFIEKLNINKLDLSDMLISLSLAVIGCLNKFTFLPFLAAIVIYYIYILFKYHPRRRLKLKTIQRAWVGMARLRRNILLGLFVTSSGLFIWFYGVNIMVHRNVVAQCGEVLGIERCMTYEPWARNHGYAELGREVDPNPARYTIGWLGGMHYRMFFTINGATGPKLYSNHTAPVVTGTAAILALVGLGLSLKHSRRILRDEPALGFILFTALVYVIALWGRNYHDYLQLGQYVAVNGRYLQLILLPLILLLIAAYQRQFKAYPAIKLSILFLSLVLFMSGGGITGFVHYSDADWYWEGNSFIINANDVLQRVFAPLFLWR